MKKRIWSIAITIVFLVSIIGKLSICVSAGDGGIAAVTKTEYLNVTMDSDSDIGTTEVNASNGAKYRFDTSSEALSIEKVQYKADNYGAKVNSKGAAFIANLGANIDTGVIVFSFDYKTNLDIASGKYEHLLYVEVGGANSTSWSGVSSGVKRLIQINQYTDVSDYGKTAEETIFSGNMATGANTGQYYAVQRGDLHNIKVELDLDNDKRYIFIDGALAYSDSFTATVPSIIIRSGISGNSGVAGPRLEVLDNIKIVHYSDIPDFEIEKASKTDDGKIALEFTDAIDNSSLTNKDFTVTDIFTGNSWTPVLESASETYVYTSSSHTKVTPACSQATLILNVNSNDFTMNNGEVYRIDAPTGITGVKGKGLTSKASCILSVGTGNYLTDIKLIDYAGNDNNYNFDAVSPYTKDIKLIFTSAAAALAAKDYIIVKQGTTPLAMATPTVTENVVDIKLNQYLVGGAPHSIEIASTGGLDKEYSIGFTTADGGVKVLKCEYYDMNGEGDGDDTLITDFSTIANGEKIKAKMTVANTTADTASVAASCGMWNDTLLKYYNFEELTLLPGEDRDSIYIVPIADKSNTIIKNYLWNGITAINAADNVYSVSNNYSQLGDNNTITISGTSDQIGATVTVEVYADDPDDTEDGNYNAEYLKALNDPTQYVGKIIYHDQTKVKENGTYSFKFNPISSTSTIYTQYMAIGGGTPVAAPLAFVSEANFQSAIDNLSSPITVQNVRDYYLELGLTNSELASLDMTDFVRILNGTVADEPLDKTKRSEVEGIIDRVLFVEGLMNGRVSDIFTIDTALTQLDSSETKDWYAKDYVLPALKSDFNTRMKGATYTSYKDYKEKLRDFFILATVKYPNGNGNIIDIMTEFDSEIDIDISRATDSTWSSLAGNDYKTLAELKTAYNTLTGSIPPLGGGGSFGGGGSGGGSGSGGSGMGSVGSVVIADSLNPTVNVADKVIPRTVFTDVEGHWAENAIVAMTEKGILSGYENGDFRPDNDVIRNELCKIVVEAFAKDTKSGSASFSDVPTDSWYYPYVSKAFELNIVKGMGNGKFAPEQKLTREDMAVMIYNAAKVSGMSFDTEGATEFNDNDAISDYAKEAVAALCNAGAVNGFEGNIFAPKGTATRAEVAKIIYSLIFE